ncbi:YbaK/EbsC family protein [Aquibaculum arenosum]|uniref:YbaK/EbsC family protein n=1 Tax=Aquibaculum arenosum TaxID=3032591 RepID=A0ABT5YJA4_9PROT|nr:YbaK/EbsC family protein [Fodinicurvata sp. CAU 1616]MDF2095027.1 YbaK/EbsC family protein [Fodinicurvata sp. CAU 1616]
MSEAGSDPASDLQPAARRVQEALAAKGLSLEVSTFPAGTRTAQDAAAAIGCEVAQIAKSLIFRARSSNRPVLAVVSGANQADESRLAALLGEEIGRANAAFVRERTGFAIGGVPPIAHVEPPVTFLDSDLQTFEEIWAAAGTPNTVFRLTPDELAAMTEAPFVELRRG